jgi:hypothetical protein
MTGIVKSAEDGDSAHSMLVTMRKALTTLVEAAKTAFKVFSAALGPAFQELGEAIQILFFSLGDAFEGFLDAGGDGRSMLENLASTMASLITTIATFIKENSDQIASFFRDLADFIHGVTAVLAELDWSKFVPLAKVLLGIAFVVGKVLGAIGRWMKRNDELLGQLATWAIIVGTVAYALFKLYGAALTVIGAASAIIGVITTLSGAFAALGGTAGILMFLYGIATLVFEGIAALVGVMLGPLGILIGIVALIAVAWIRDWARVREVISASVNFLIQQALVLVATWTLIPRLIIAALKDGLSGVKRVLVDYFDSWNELIFDSGKTLIKELAKGIVAGNKFVIDAIKGAVEKASKFFPSSPAEEGPFSGSGAPKARGESTMKDFAEGIEGTNIDVGSSLGEIPKDDMKIGTEMTMPTQQSQLEASPELGAIGGKTINIDEKAIYFEAGAFEGVSDEEIPEMVRDELDDSLDRIIEDLEASGQEDDPRRRGAGAGKVV